MLVNGLKEVRLGAVVFDVCMKMVRHVPAAGTDWTGFAGVCVLVGTPHPSASLVEIRRTRSDNLLGNSESHIFDHSRM